MLWEETLIIIRPFYEIIFLVFLILWHEISFFDKVPCKKVFCMFIFLIDELAKMVIQSKKGFFILFLVYAMWYYMYLFSHKCEIHPMWNGRYMYPIHDKYYIYIYIYIYLYAAGPLTTCGLHTLMRRTCCERFTTYNGYRRYLCAQYGNVHLGGFDY